MLEDYSNIMLSVLHDHMVEEKFYLCITLGTWWRATERNRAYEVGSMNVFKEKSTQTGASRISVAWGFYYYYWSSIICNALVLCSLKWGMLSMWRIDLHLMNSLTSSGRGWFCGEGRKGLREAVFLWETSGRLKRKSPQKTSWTGCLVTLLQVWRRHFCSWKSLLGNTGNPDYVHKNSSLLVYIKGGTWIQRLKDRRQNLF